MGKLKSIFWVFGVVLLVSCRPDQNEMAVLDQVIEDYSEENTLLYESMARQVENEGNRPKEIEVLEKAKAGFLHPQFVKPDIDSVNMGFLIHIKDSLVFLADQVGLSNYGLSGFKVTSSQKVKKLLQIGMLQLEKEYLEFFAKKIGGSCAFNIPIYLNIKEDTGLVDQLVNLTLNLSDYPYQNDNYQYENLSLTNNDQKIDFEHEAIKSTLIISFVPKVEGMYLLKGDFVTEFSELHYDYTYHFDFEIPVK